MTAPHRFAYAQARVQARFAALPGAEEWQRLAAARSLAAFLEEARAGSLRPWVKGLSAESDPHALELGLRALAWDQIREVAPWIPRPWRNAVAWVGWLPYLPVFEQAARGLALPPWVARDPRLRPFLGPDRRLDRAALEPAGIASLAGPGEPERAAARWIAEWQRRWPAGGRQTRVELAQLCALVGAHLAAFRAASPAETWGLRRTLGERLRLLFHRHSLGPLPVFAYLALVLLELERLRAELLRRSLGLPWGLPASLPGGSGAS